MEIRMKNKTWKLLVLTLLFLSVTIFSGFYLGQESQHMINLTLDNRVTEVITEAETVGEFLEEEDIKLDERGYINLSLDKKINEGLDIIVVNPRSYTLSIDESQWYISSRYSKVKDILYDLDIRLGEDDYSVPDLNSNISSGEDIQLFFVEEEIEILEEEIPFEKIVKKNSKLEVGKTKTIQKGQKGLKEISIKKTFVNGKFVEEVIAKEEMLVEKMDEIIENGTKKKPVVKANRGGTPPKGGDVITMSATAYDLSFASTGKRPGDKYYGMTASGTMAKPGTVAVDPRVIPLGTKLYVESLDGTPDYGYATAEDTGGAIKGNKIDLFFHSATDVRNFGRRKVKVHILR